MAVLTPHFNLPFRFGSVVEQGTGKDLVNCVYAIALTPQGWREEAPYFGIPNLAFDFPPVVKENIKSNIIAQEPRAEMLFSEEFGMSEFERIVKIAVEQHRTP